MWNLPTLFVLGAAVFFTSAMASRSRSEVIGKLPPRSCNLNRGILCFPDACSNYTCSLLDKTICIADRCGCEARVFKKHAEIWKEVTNVCKVYNNAQATGNFSLEDEDAPKPGAPTGGAAVDKDKEAKEAIAQFKQYTLLLSELVSDLAGYIKKSATANPTKATVKRLRQAVASVRALKRAARILESFDDVETFSDEDVGKLAGAMHAISTIARNVLKTNQTLAANDKKGELIMSDAGIVPFFYRLYNGAERTVANLFSGFNPYSIYGARFAGPGIGLGFGLPFGGLSGFGGGGNVLPVINRIPAQIIVQPVPVNPQPVPVNPQPVPVSPQWTAPPSSENNMTTPAAPIVKNELGASEGF